MGIKTSRPAPKQKPVVSSQNHTTGSSLGSFPANRSGILLLSILYAERYTERRISYDAFVNYEGRLFGVTFSNIAFTARVMRKDDMIYIDSSDLKQLLNTHDVRRDDKAICKFCIDCQNGTKDV